MAYTKLYNTGRNTSQWNVKIIRCIDAIIKKLDLVDCLDKVRSYRGMFINMPSWLPASFIVDTFYGVL